MSDSVFEVAVGRSTAVESAVAEHGRSEREVRY